MTERKQPDVLSAGDQCGGRIAHINSVWLLEGKISSTATTRARRRRVRGGDAEAGRRGGVRSCGMVWCGVVKGEEVSE